MDVDKPFIQYNTDTFFFQAIINSNRRHTNNEISKGIFDVIIKFRATTLDGTTNQFIMEKNTVGAHIHRISKIEMESTITVSI